MLLIFPIIYVGSFIYSLIRVLGNKVQDILIFLIFGLPVYTTTLSICFINGFSEYIPLLQSFKELIILVTLGHLLYYQRGRIKLHLVDKLFIGFLLYTALYVFLPIGQYGFMDKLLALKSLSFFVLVYFTGRFFDPRKIVISKYFHFICLVTVVASAVLIYEVVNYQHFQTITGYADFNYYYFNQDPSGNYGLSWTFEIENGAKRFASFFANPLEHSAATLLTISVLAGLCITNNNRIKIDRFGLLVLGCTAFSIFFSLSRASFASYFLMIYLFAILTKKKYIIWFIHACFIAAVMYVLFFMDKDLQGFIISTLNFSNPSSLGHVLEWLDGIQALGRSPLGIGLGESGKVALALGQNVGGENQFIIIAVQAGILALLLYLTIYFLLIKNAWQKFNSLKGKEKKICLALLLMKIGFLVPMMTSNFESYIYLSYLSWFFSGLFINMISQPKTAPILTQPGVPGI
jgi:hypothetical protein